MQCELGASSMIFWGRGGFASMHAYLWSAFSLGTCLFLISFLCFLFVWELLFALFCLPDGCSRRCDSVFLSFFCICCIAVKGSLSGWFYVVYLLLDTICILLLRFRLTGWRYLVGVLFWLRLNWLRRIVVYPNSIFLLYIFWVSGHDNLWRFGCVIFLY